RRPSRCREGTCRGLLKRRQVRRTAQESAGRAGTCLTLSRGIGPCISQVTCPKLTNRDLMSEHLPSVEQIEAISRIPDYAEALTRLGELVDNDVLNALASDEPPPDWPPGAPPYSQKESAEHWLEASPDERRRLIMLLLA